LPLLARLAPEARVLGVAIGGGELAELRRFGEQLARVVADLSPRPLLLISSDMNHHASEARTRRIDRPALEALEACDPQRLFETVEERGISMCGLRPAVVVMYALQALGALRRCELVGYTTSAEASGDTQSVVGYAGALFA
jgi:AmmeMemoRadiSam system protein B